MSLESRFWDKVETGEGCWLWTAATFPSGYGALSNWPGNPVLAHRVSWEIHHGPIPDDLTIDHLCHTRRCVNPEHLEPVTRVENSRRQNGGTDTHFACGHQREGNTYRRGCHACKLRQGREYRRKAKLG